MNNKIAKIIEESTFTIQNGRFIYAKVSKAPEAGKYFMIVKDVDEITVVTQEANLHELDIIERNKDCWKLIALIPSISFYCVGFLATVSQIVAEANIDILMVSTYSKDYILVQEGYLEKTKSLLLKLGFREKEKYE